MTGRLGRDSGRKPVGVGDEAEVQFQKQGPEETLRRDDQSLGLKFREKGEMKLRRPDGSSWAEAPLLYLFLGTGRAWMWLWGQGQQWTRSWRDSFRFTRRFSTCQTGTCSGTLLLNAV